MSNKQIAEYVADIYIATMDVPTEELDFFFEEAIESMTTGNPNATIDVYIFYKKVKAFVIEQRMKEALN